MESGKEVCWMCGKEIDLGDKYCRYCGKGQNKNAKMPYTFIGIFALLFVIGPLCLINLWKSPLIKKEEKTVFTAVIVFFTILIIGIIIYGIYFIINYYMKALSIT